MDFDLSTDQATIRAAVAELARRFGDQYWMERDMDWPDEIAEAGDVYFFLAGHSLIYDEPSEVLELNPAAASQSLTNHIETTMAAGWSNAPARSSSKEASHATS